ncbi:hypothetical protein CBS101457_000096 [Exobasidium rhododendri]|nr:hypothetical protein CBS101457_000096 [Exobasidium rhododendri]
MTVLTSMNLLVCLVCLYGISRVGATPVPMFGGGHGQSYDTHNLAPLPETLEVYYPGSPAPLSDAFYGAQGNKGFYGGSSLFPDYASSHHDDWQSGPSLHFHTAGLSTDEAQYSSHGLHKQPAYNDTDVSNSHTLPLHFYPPNYPSVDQTFSVTDHIDTPRLSFLPRLTVPSASSGLPSDLYGTQQSRNLSPGSFSQFTVNQSSVDHRRKAKGVTIDISLQSSPTVKSGYIYVPPWEYTIPVDADFDYDEQKDFIIFDKLSKDQKILVVDRIMQIRPYSGDAVRKKLQVRLDAFLAKQLLSDNVTWVEDAVEVLYPIRKRKMRYYQHPWMSGLTNAQRRQVIVKFADATEQPVDHLREFFLLQMVTPDVAVKILEAPTKKACEQIAVKYGLLIQENPRNAPWQKGCSNMQKKALIHRMMTVGRQEKMVCYQLLQKSTLPSGVGLMMLRVSDEKFPSVMASLQRAGPAWLPL